MRPSIDLAPGAESNGFATMLADLLRQNLEAKPHKTRDFDALSGTFAIVAEDADVALTLAFARGRLVVHDGILNVPDVTIRGTADVIMAMSNVPLTRWPLALPLPRNREALAVLRQILAAMQSGAFHAHGLAFHPRMMMRLTRVLSVNG